MAPILEMSQNKISPHFVQVGQYAEKASQYGSLVVGGFYQDWALQIINWSTIGYILLGLVLTLVPLKLYLKYRAKQYVEPFSHGLEIVTDGLGNVAIGGLGVAWVKLAVGLYPFFLTDQFRDDARTVREGPKYQSASRIETILRLL